jgi:outer membrane lipoprotein-sorting protein
MAIDNQDKKLANLLKSARPLPRPGAEEKALRAMSEVIGLDQARPFRRKRLRRLLIAGAAVILLIAPALWLTSRPGPNSALAAVAEAMAKIKSVHCTGFEIHFDGKRSDFEMWLKQPEKFRAKAKIGKVTEEISDDGKKRIRLRHADGLYSATISPSNGIPEDEFSLNWFSKEGMFEMTRSGIIASHSALLPNGREADVLEIAGFDPDYSKTRVTIDKTTNLLAQLEEFRDGKMVLKIADIEYDREMPDAMFSIEIPKNALVNDELNPKPESPEIQAKWADIEKRMAKENAELIASGISRGGGGGAPRHSGIKLLFTGPDKNAAWYSPSRNAYYVFGKAVVTDSKVPGYKHEVEDGWVPAPYKPDRLPGDLVMRIDKPGDFREFRMLYDRGYDGFCVERIQNVGKGPLIIMDDGVGLTFYGEAKIYPQGTLYPDGQKNVLEQDIRPYLQEYDIAKADFGNLPASEIKAMKAEMEKHNKALRRYWQDEKTAVERLGDKGVRGSNCPPGMGGQAGDFQTDPEVGMILYYIPSRDAIYVAGRAKILERHLLWRNVKIVENEEIKAPGPEYKQFYEQQKKRSKQIEEYNKQHTKLTLEEWLKHHPELQ